MAGTNQLSHQKGKDMDYLLNGLIGGAFAQWIEAVLAVVGAASAVAAITPTRKDDDIVSRIARVVDVIALNIGYARRK
jgi:hypothetical protein